MQVIVSLTTIPPRMPLIAPVVMSLLNSQKHKIYKLVIQIPKTYKSWPSGALPSFLYHPRIEINQKCSDDGPITKVLGFADSVVDKCMFVYVDDDHVYPPEFISAHVRAHELCPKTVFTTRGGLLHNNTRVTTHEPWFRRVHTADGVQGVSVMARDVNWKLLASRAREWIKTDNNAYTSDDVVLSVLFWEQHLPIRIAPCCSMATPLKHAGDEHALCTGRNGTLLSTTERYHQVCLPQEWISSVVESNELWTSVSDSITDAADNNDVAIAIFAYQRPDLLSKVLESMLKNTWFLEKHRPVYLFLDGPMHPKTGWFEGNVSLWKENQRVFRRYIPSGICIAAPVNYGVGVMQFWALSTLATRYKNVIMLEDDLILGPSYLQTLWSLREFCSGTVGSVQAGYRREHGAPHLVRITDAASEHVHYWGWLTTSDAWKRISNIYTKAVHDLFVGQYYRHRDLERVKLWFQQHNIIDNGHYSQDWVRDACFKLSGMPYKLYTPCRRGVPIGRDGLHSSSAIFDRMGLDDSVSDVMNVPAFNLSHAVLTWDPSMNISIIKPVCASVLGHHNTVLVPSKTEGKRKRYIVNARKDIKDHIQELFSACCKDNAACSLVA